MAKKVERVLVLVFGATTGVTLHEFIVGQGFRQIWNRDIPWVRRDNVYIWPMDWLIDLLRQVKDMATPGTVIVPAMWGADVVHMYKDKIWGKVLHYRSIPEEFARKHIHLSGINACEWSRLMGNVHPAFYQMVFSSAYWRQQNGCGNHLQVVPLADWMTWQLSGQKGHDQVMLYNQGAGVPTSKLVNSYFDDARRSQFAPVWPLFHSDQLLEIGNGAYVVPCTHDSPLARTVLASTGLPWGLWTGSWYGIFRTVSGSDMIEPGERTFSAGLVFEAMPNNGLSAISNIGMHGPFYKALKDAFGEKNYEDAAGLALANLDAVVKAQSLFTDQAMSRSPEAFVGACKGMREEELGWFLATMVNTIAMNCKAGLFNAREALGMPMPSDVAIVGGFAENPAILKALQMHGINAVVPPFAGLATQAGAAAEALRRAGMAKDTSEALQLLPNCSL